jgi:hypothetical protein
MEACMQHDRAQRCMVPAIMKGRTSVAAAACEAAGEQSALSGNATIEAPPPHTLCASTAHHPAMCRHRGLIE